MFIRLVFSTTTMCSPCRPLKPNRASTWWPSRTRRSVHNIVVCTLCSCYPWDVLGLPPVWYKSAAYRARTVMEPRAVLADFGVDLAGATRNPRLGFHRRDRYLVLPMRPAGTDGWSEDRLAALVTRDSMIGTGLPKRPASLPMNGIHDMGGMDGLRQGRARAERAGVPRAGKAARSR